MILVPIKNLQSAKQRLASVLNARERFSLAAAMLEDVVDALAACSRRDEVAFVTGDPHAQRLAREFSFEIIADAANPGETDAIEMATRICCERGADYTMVIPGDIPLISAREIDMIFTAAPPGGTVLVPSRSGRGTNAVFRRPADLFPLRFGNDSFVPHLAAARHSGKPAHVLRLEGVGLDIDEPADLDDLLATPGLTRAQALLRQWHVEDRLISAAAG